MRRERAHLLEGTVVEEEGEALAGRELAPAVLLGDAVGAAALERPRAHGAKDFEMVVHSVILAVRSPAAPRPDGPVRAAGWRLAGGRAALADRSTRRRTRPTTMSRG